MSVKFGLELLKFVNFNTFHINSFHTHPVEYGKYDWVYFILEETHSEKVL